MKTKMADGEDLLGMLPTTALEDVMIGLSLPFLMTVELAQEEGTKFLKTIGCVCVAILWFLFSGQEIQDHTDLKYF